MKTGILIISSLLSASCMMSCSDEPQQTDRLPIRPLIEVICEIDDDSEFNTPENPPEYIIINSARDIANLPEDTLAKSANLAYSKIDFAKNTLIVMTSVVYCEPDIENDDWNWASADLSLSKDFQLDIRYSNCSVSPTAYYTLKCKLQFGLTTDKIPSDA